MKLRKFIFLLLISIIFIPNVSAATMSLSGDSSVTVGNEITVTLKFNANDINSVSGNLSWDSNYLTPMFETTKPISYDNSCSFYAASSNKMITCILLSAGKTYSNGATAITFKFKAIKTGTTTVSFKDSAVSTSYERLASGDTSKSITIKEPASTNNYLSSLSVTNGSINFNKNTTSYSVSVDASVTSISISATAEDSKASVSGTGTKELKYGNNTFNVVVTAEDGSKKTYSVTVNRKDDRSSNNSLVAEKTTDVKVTVTAENGETRTYTISVKRGKDPNKVLSTDNYLNSITVDQGILSPVFDKEKTNYAVYLPFEVSTINISYEVSDTEYATVDVEGDSNLSVGNNVFKYIVTAENGETRTYTITVVRNASLDDVELSSNTNITSIEINNGKITNVFKNENHVYYYKGSSLEINLTLEDENSKYEIVDIGKVYIAIIEAQNGEKDYYVFIPKSYNIIGIIVGFILGGLIGACIILLISKKGIKFNRFKK